MNILVLDGHPGSRRLVTSLLDSYVAALGPEATVTRIAVRNLSFDPNLKAGYSADQTWEPDLEAFGHALLDCDHLVVGFPLWWGGEPAMLKGLLDRVLLPGFAFSYHRNDSFWDRLLSGRSVDLIVTMDAPPWFVRFVQGDPVVRRWRSQILGFCGFKPIRVFRFGPTRRGGAKKNIHRWQKKLQDAAATAHTLKRGPKSTIVPDRDRFTEAIKDRRA
jgi:NAD(P)H dehydrogenase (quinone)